MIENISYARLQLCPFDTCKSLFTPCHVYLSFDLSQMFCISTACILILREFLLGLFNVPLTWQTLYMKHLIVCLIPMTHFAAKCMFHSGTTLGFEMYVSHYLIVLDWVLYVPFLYCNWLLIVFSISIPHLTACCKFLFYTKLCCEFMYPAQSNWHLT